ncbi:MAG: acetylornithine deacetylase/succinyl-diaminopimelate desuccinylase-like protein [Myxococcota bacterium]|jgi:acetylornithine deacetylase/succinyl-diaminopimelate desuccinylase-like protein
MTARTHPLMDRIDWQKAGDETLALLSRLLRHRTINSPDCNPDETSAASMIADLFRAEGMEPEVLESAPGRGNVLCRIPGDGTGGEPILLSGHLDVVPVELEQWKRDPFAGEVHDGWMWGRGAVDMKHMVAMEVMTMVLLHRLGVPLKRDLIFAGVADEEAGCEQGSLWLARNHPDKIRGEYVISEIGGFTLHMAGKHFYPVQVAEKGICWLTITARGTPGHGSLPNRDNPIAAISRAAELLATKRLPHHVTPVVERFVRTLAQHQKVPNSLVLKGLLNKPLCGHILDNIFPDPSLASTFDAILHNTANPTILKAGLKINQVPGEASVQVDGRLLPGQTGADLIEEIKRLIGAGFEYTIDKEMPASVTEVEDPIAGLIDTVLTRHDRKAVPIRNLLPGFTDAKAYTELGMKCWGFSPLKLPPGSNFAAMFHGHNERVPVDGVRWGLTVLMDLVSGMVAK